jgi:hypothetical protein
MNFITFFPIFVGNFCPPDPDPQHCFFYLFNYLFISESMFGLVMSSGALRSARTASSWARYRTTGTAESSLSECLFLGHVGCCVPDPGGLSRIRVFSIPDSGSEFFPSRIRFKKYFNTKKWFLKSRKYDPGCPSRILIPDPDPDFLPIPYLGVKKAPDTGSATLVGSLNGTGTVRSLIQSLFGIGTMVFL